MSGGIHDMRPERLFEHSENARASPVRAPGHSPGKSHPPRPQPYLAGYLRDACAAARRDHVVVEPGGLLQQLLVQAAAGNGAATETYRSQ
jgi:hypothetical protein